MYFTSAELMKNCKFPKASKKAVCVNLRETLPLVGQTEGKHLLSLNETLRFAQGDNLFGQPPSQTVSG